MLRISIELASSLTTSSGRIVISSEIVGGSLESASKCASSISRREEVGRVRAVRQGGGLPQPSLVGGTGIAAGGPHASLALGILFVRAKGNGGGFVKAGR